MKTKAFILVGLLFAATQSVSPVSAQFGFGTGSYSGGTYSLNAVSDQLRSSEKTADAINKNVMFFLQASGRWPAQQKDAAVLMALDALKSGLRNARRAADGNDASKLMNQLTQVNVIAQNTTTAAQQAGLDPMTIGQLQTIQNNIRIAANSAQNASVYCPPNTFPGSGGAFSNSLSLLNTQMLGPNQLSITWRQANGRVSTYTSQVGSYMLTDGLNARPAVGDEVNLLKVAYAQAGAIGGGGFTPGFNPGYNPGGYRPVQPGVLQASGNGKGQFVMLGQVFMNIRNTSINASDPFHHRGVLTINAGRDTINFTGTLNNQSPTSATFNIDGCDRGPASGSIFTSLNGNSNVTSANGTGMLNGQAFNLSFRGN